jgi:hypothetical protein
MASKLLKKQLRKSLTRQKVQKRLARLTGLADQVYLSETHRTIEDTVQEYEDLQYFKTVAQEDAYEHYYR